MKIKGAIFDVDGTLLDSMKIWDNIGDEYLLSLGKTPEENLRSVISGMSLAGAAKYFIEKYGVNKTSEQISSEVNSMIEDKYRYEIKLKPGAGEFLKELSRGGAKMCIATATDEYLVRAALDRCEIGVYFGEIFTCSKIGKSKNEPDIFEAALSFLNTDKENTLVFEDALHAVKTAVGAGFKTAAMRDESEKNPLAVKSLSDYYFNGFDEAIKFLKIRNGEINI